MVTSWVACMVVVAFGGARLSAQTALRSPGQIDANVTNQALSQDVSRPYGEYRYAPQTGLYKDVTLGDAFDDLRQGGQNVGAFLGKLNLITGWSQPNPEGFSSDVLARVGPFNLPILNVQWGSPYNNNYDGLQLRAGPAMLDNFYLSYGLIYSDLQGAYPRRERLQPDDRWAQIVTLSFRLSLAVRDSIGVSIQPYLYWLPEKGTVGWGVPGPLAGFSAFQPNAVALFQVAWNQRIGNWHYTVYDVFNPRLHQYNIWDVFLSSQAVFGNLSPVDRVGRYTLGYGNADLTNYDPQARFGIGSSANHIGLAGYYNVLGGQALGDLGDNTKSLFYLYRSDLWDSKFKTVSTGLSGGVYLQSGDPFFSTYAGYNFYYSLIPQGTFLNWAVVGAKKQLGQSLSVYSQVGGYWYSGDVKGPYGWLATAGLTQRLGQRTGLYLEVGRRILTPIVGLYGVENYVDYRMTHMLGNKSSIAVYIGQSERTIENVGNSQTFRYAGLTFNTLLTMRLSAFASSGWTHSATGASAAIYDIWTHRFGLRHNPSANIQLQAFYQYEDLRSNSAEYNLTEHYIYLGVTKRF